APAPAADCATAAPPPAPAPAADAGALQLSLSQLDVAKKIVGTAKAMSISERGVVIALQTAKQESQLDAFATVGRSTGAFQQIAPGPANAYAGYDRTDPAAAARGFFTVLLARDSGYANDPRDNADIAQLVQASGAGASHYAPWKHFAETLTSVLYAGTTAMTCAVGGKAGPTAIQVNGPTVTLPRGAGVTGSVTTASPETAKVLGAALSWLGTPYAWGGGTPSGPSRGIRDGGVADAHGDFNKIGFDCSGLVLYSYAQVGVSLPHSSADQFANGGQSVPWPQAQPGDLLFYGAAVHHVALFLGVLNGVPYMIEAPQSGDVVKVSAVRTGGDFRTQAVRPIPGGGAAAHA
ncbi:NlpC/P60 family protein, partial [Amycolatopsis sp. NPDC000740]|uniref:C40 family peptidase n=1 Tax=Amycolatopsis sp. NPDC000740 TaxID=3154269 RepID=UPI003331BA82